jgi:predicted MFS family arabinose efflux permease
MAGWSHRHTVLSVTVSAFFCTMSARVVISPLVPEIIESFAVSKAVVGLALTGMWAVFALLQFPAGVLGERFGERAVVLAALAFTAGGSLLVAVAPSFPAFAATVLVVGVGAGLFMPAAASLLTKLFAETGRALGVNSIGAPLGGLVAPVAATALAARYGWRTAPLAVAALTATVFALGVWRVRPTTPERPNAAMRDRFEPGVVLGLLARPPVVYTSVLAVVGFFAYQSFTSFFPTFLVQQAGYDAGRAGTVFGATFGLAIVGAPAQGWLSDRVGRDAVLAGAFLAGAAGLLVFMTAQGPIATATGTALLGAGISWPGVLNSRFMDLFSDAERGAWFGLVRTGFLLVSSLGSVTTGALADAFGWAVAYGTVAALLVLAVALIAANRLLGTEW